MRISVDSCLDHVLGVLLPPCCVLCQGPGQAPALDLCAGCAADLPAAGRERCTLCALPLEPGQGPVCSGCRAAPPQFARCLAAFEYAPPVDHLVQDLKYHGRLANGRVLGTLLADAVRVPGGPAGAACGADLVVPVPLHPTRLAERGYNQAEEIARWTARALGLAFAPRGLRRLRATPPQVGLGRATRWANLADAFDGSARLAGRRVVLVDDVVTSAATANSAAAAALAAGADRVEVWAVARAGH